MNRSGDGLRLALMRPAVVALSRALPYLPERLLLRFIYRFVSTVPYPGGRYFLSRMFYVAQKVLSTRSVNCRNKVIYNFLGNSIVLGHARRMRFEEEEGFQPPYFLVVSPTMRCNLNCYGCYAGSYTKKDDLETEVVDDIMRQSKELGMYFMTFSGGEPFIRQDILDLAAKHNDMYFQVYTNGTLIDEKMADKLVELGNVFPAISVEGFKKETDERRGPGAFEKITGAMDRLKERGVPFGFSATVTRENNEFVVSEEFVDFYMQKGCLLGWYFNYIPIGRKPDLSLMPTPEQRIYRLERLRELRKTRPILLADFWNDGPLVGGCIAGGRRYLHINAKGDVEPCVFIHFAVDNIKEKSLLDILRSDLFKEIRRRQPYSKNYLRPCMIIDNPYILRQVVAKCGAHATHPGGETVITELKDALDNYARRYAEIADKVWQEEYLTDGKRLYADIPSRDEATKRLQGRARAGLPGASDFHQYTLF